MSAGGANAGRERLTGFAAAGGCALLWAGFVALSRFGLVTSLGPMDMAVLRFAGAGLVMLPWFPAALSTIGGPRSVVLAVTGGLGFAFPAFYGLSLAPSGHGAVLMPGTLPLHTAVLGWLLLGAPITRRRAIGLVLIGLGIAGMLWDSRSIGSSSQMLGDCVLLLAPFCWGLFTILAQRWGVSAMQAACVVPVVSSIILLPPYLMFFDSAIPTAPLSHVAVQAIYQGLGGVILSVLLFIHASRTLGPSRAAMITAVVPALAVLMAVPIVGEVPSLLTLLGIALVTAGMVSAIRA